MGILYVLQFFQVSEGNCQLLAKISKDEYVILAGEITYMI